MKLTVGQVWKSNSNDHVTAVVKDCRKDEAVGVQVRINDTPVSKTGKWVTMSLEQLEAQFTLASDPRSKTHRPDGE